MQLCKYKAKIKVMQINEHTKKRASKNYSQMTKVLVRFKCLFTIWVKNIVMNNIILIWISPTKH
jgi:hypothetical protein